MFSGYALIVSASEYKNINNLGQSVINDGDDLLAALLDENLCGYGPGRTSRLSGIKATAENILEELSNLARLADANDPVLFFFSGHGIDAPAGTDIGSGLLTYEYDQPSKEGMILADELRERWARIKSRRKLMVLDSCHSGGVSALKAQLADGKAGLSQDTLDALASGRGNVIIGSSRSEEYSYILHGDRNSLFTKHFIAGLKGSAGHNADGFIGVFDLFTFAAEQVRKDHPHQHPVFSSRDLEDNFPVAYCSVVSRRKSRHEPVIFEQNSKLIDVLVKLVPELYPLGPRDISVWERAGGDVSRLTLTGNGRNDWFQAVKLIRQGGGGINLTTETLVREILMDFPHHPTIRKFVGS